MGHASFATTQRYIKYAEQHAKKAYNAHVPPSLAGSA
jgi:site-specific recombinase XerD